MPSDNPTVYCAVHAKQFVKVGEEIGYTSVLTWL